MIPFPGIYHGQQHYVCKLIIVDFQYLNLLFACIIKHDKCTYYIRLTVINMIFIRATGDSHFSSCRQPRREKELNSATTDHALFFARNQFQSSPSHSASNRRRGSSGRGGINSCTHSLLNFRHQLGCKSLLCAIAMNVQLLATDKPHLHSSAAGAV